MTVLFNKKSFCINKILHMEYLLLLYRHCSYCSMIRAWMQWRSAPLVQSSKSQWQKQGTRADQILPLPLSTEWLHDFKSCTSIKSWLRYHNPDPSEIQCRHLGLSFGSTIHIQINLDRKTIPACADGIWIEHRLLIMYLVFGCKSGRMYFQCCNSTAHLRLKSS